jgi:hypothetical protein
MGKCLRQDAVNGCSQLIRLDVVNMQDNTHKGTDRSKQFFRKFNFFRYDT